MTKPAVLLDVLFPSFVEELFAPVWCIYSTDVSQLLPWPVLDSLSA